MNYDRLSNINNTIVVINDGIIKTSSYEDDIKIISAAFDVINFMNTIPPVMQRDKLVLEVFETLYGYKDGKINVELFDKSTVCIDKNTTISGRTFDDISINTFASVIDGVFDIDRFYFDHQLVAKLPSGEFVITSQNKPYSLNLDVVTKMQSMVKDNRLQGNHRRLVAFGGKIHYSVIPSYKDLTTDRFDVFYRNALTGEETFLYTHCVDQKWVKNKVRELGGKPPSLFERIFGGLYGKL